MLQPGDKLGPYEILVLIGKGGMGEVFRATDARLLRTSRLRSCPVIKSLTRTARNGIPPGSPCCFRLNHPNIVTLYDIAQDNGIDYLVMEYVPGKSLDKLIPHPRTPSRRSAQLRQADRERPRGGACGWHRPSGYEARQRDGDLAWRS